MASKRRTVAPAGSRTTRLAANARQQKDSGRAAIALSPARKLVHRPCTAAHTDTEPTNNRPKTKPMARRDYSHLSQPELVELLKRRDAQAHFGLVWERDAIEHDKKLNSEFVGLKLESTLSFGEPPYSNLIIEGDNFDALRHLLMTHAGRVNVIYIDPPYNTGNTGQREGWVYNDHRFDPNSRFRHSTWLEFMFPRLQLAHDLLADSGVIFISIDDAELYNLKLLMDRVFGPSNFIANIVWKNVTDNNPSRVAVEHEYVLVYAKEKAANPPEWKSSDHPAKEALLKIGAELNAQYSDPAELQAVYTAWYRENKPFLGPLSDYKFIDSGGVYAGSRSVHNPGKLGYEYDVFHPVTGKACKRPMNGYRFPPETMEELLKSGLILFGEDEDKIIELKVYAKDFLAKLPSVIDLDGRKGPNELKRIFGGVLPFNNPKPSELITQLLRFVSGPNDVIVDFFAGSGTTGHAVLELNREDGGKRRFILVSSTEAIKDGDEEQRERNLCRDVCAKRVSTLMASGDGETQPFGGSFAYLRAQPILRHRLEQELDDQTIWNAVLLLHDLPLRVLGEPLGWVELADGTAVAYSTGTRQRDIAAFVRKAAEFSGPIHCYAWAPGRFAAAVPRATVHSLPETLQKKFRHSAALLLPNEQQEQQRIDEATE
jgi:adenine-specific DNA-methyltransferase